MSDVTLRDIDIPFTRVVKIDSLVKSLCRSN